MKEEKEIKEKSSFGKLFKERFGVK